MAQPSKSKHGGGYDTGACPAYNGAWSARFHGSIPINLTYSAAFGVKEACLGVSGEVNQSVWLGRDTVSRRHSVLAGANDHLR
jgi:hypothetical protein